MKIGRNAPCPCGSGKKYKKCCLALEQMGDARQKEAVRESGAGAIRRAADKAAEWQVDVIPIPIRIETDPSSRPCAVLVTAGGFVLDHDMLDRPVPEPEAVAELMLRSVRSAMGRLGMAPNALRVRRQEMVEALADRIGSLGFLGLEGADDGLVEVPIRSGEMSDLDDAAFALIEGFCGVQARFFVCRPETWSAWGLPEETVTRIFSAAVAFYRAAPWETLANLDVLEIETSAPSGTASRIGHRTWTATIMGMGKEEYGLALYSNADDFWKLVETPAWAVEESFADPTGEVISLTFDAGHAVAPAMRREIGRAGWEVAGPAAYPSAMTINTLAGGLPRRDAEALAAILEAVPRFVETHAEAIETGRPVPPTTDAEAGLTIAYTAEAAEAMEEHGSGSGWGDPWGVEFPGSLTVLTPGSAEGPGADPAAVLEGSELRSAEHYQALLDEELEITERFAEHLRTAAGFKEATVEKHRWNAELFVHFLVDSRGVPVRAVHEYHLRLFLFDWYPRKVAASLTEARSVPVSLGRFFDYLAAEAGIFCRWAKSILSARDTFEERWESCPGGFFMDEQVIDWRIPHEDDLVSRVMVPDDRLGDDAEWADFMGPKEADLLNELHARWLLWRDEAIRSGRAHPDELHAHLADLQHAWETTPLPRLGGKSPYEVVVAEQAERPAR